jgi:hypothetical protein
LREADLSKRRQWNCRADLRFANGVTLSAKFDGEFAGGAQTYVGTGTLRVSW